MNGLLPGTFGTIMIVDITDIKTSEKYFTNYTMLESAFNKVGRVIDSWLTSNKLIPMGYSHGHLIVALSPDIFNKNYPNLTLDRHKNHIKFKSNIPDEFKWFFVESIEIYERDADATDDTQDASIKARNYYTVPVPSDYTYTYRSDGEILLSKGRDSSGVDPIERLPDKNPSTIGDGDGVWPRRNYQNIWTTQYVTMGGFIHGIADPIYGGRGNLYSGVDMYNDSNLTTYTYNGNRKTLLKSSEVRNHTFFLNSKLKLIRSFQNSISQLSDNKLNNDTNSTIIEDNSSTWWPGHGVFRETFGTARYNYGLPLQYTHLSRYLYGYPDSTITTSMNLGNDYEATLGGYHTALATQTVLKEIINGVFNFLLAPNKLEASMAIVNSGVNSLFAIADRLIIRADLDKVWNDVKTIPDVSGNNIIVDNFDSWEIALPQTATLENDKNNFIKSKKDPFLTIPVNKLFKSVDEFNDWLKLNKISYKVYAGYDEITGQMKVNLKPWMDTDYNKVWEYWAQQRNVADVNIKRGYHKRIDGDTNILFKHST